MKNNFKNILEDNLNEASGGLDKTNSEIAKYYAKWQAVAKSYKGRDVMIPTGKFAGRKGQITFVSVSVSVSDVGIIASISPYKKDGVSLVGPNDATRTMHKISDKDLV